MCGVCVWLTSSMACSRSSCSCSISRCLCSSSSWRLMYSCQSIQSKSNQCCQWASKEIKSWEGIQCWAIILLLFLMFLPYNECLIRITIFKSHRRHSRHLNCVPQSTMCQLCNLTLWLQKDLARTFYLFCHCTALFPFKPRYTVKVYTVIAELHNY